MRYERILNESVGRYRERVESLTGRNLGDVCVEKSDRYNFQTNVGFFLIATGIANGYFATAYVENKHFVSESRVPIQFTPCAGLNLFPRRTIEFIAAHEMGHIAHFKGRNEKELEGMDEFIVDAVADYIAVRTLGETKIPFFSKTVSQSINVVEEALRRLGKTFKEALPSLGFDYREAVLVWKH